MEVHFRRILLPIYTTLLSISTQRHYETKLPFYMRLCFTLRYHYGDNTGPSRATERHWHQSIHNHASDRPVLIVALIKSIYQSSCAAQKVLDKALSESEEIKWETFLINSLPVTAVGVVTSIKSIFLTQLKGPVVLSVPLAVPLITKYLLQISQHCGNGALVWERWSFLLS